MIKYLVFTYAASFIIIGLYRRDFKLRLFNVLVSLDQTLYVIFTTGYGYPDETISSACYRYELLGNPIAKIIRPFIDWLFSPLEKNHCYNAYLAEVNRTQIF